jgi:STE24 endopeptidase
MQLFPILLIAVILAADGGVRLWSSQQPPSFGETLLGMSVAIVGALAMAWIITRRCRRQIDRIGRTRAIQTAERAARHCRWAILLVHVLAVLGFGWLDAVRSVIGNPILIDEIITLLPAVLGVLGTWWIFYPIERRIREALLIRRLDLGQPIHPMPSRWRYVWEQARTGLLLLLVPLLLILGLAETIRTLAPESAAHLIDFATLIAALSVFLIAPLLARLLLSVESLPQGELRETLLDICRQHNVRVRDILLWRTSGSMINAAVMGLTGRLRYVLITDALLESMSLVQIRAVMAHEVGHVRKHHMPWMVISLIAVLVATLAVIDLPLIAAEQFDLIRIEAFSPWLVPFMLIAQLAAVLLIFGWISRRFERQADAFAVEHLSTTVAEESNAPEHDESTHDRAETPDDGPAASAARANVADQTPRPNARTPLAERTIHPAAVSAMCSALQAVAELNAVDPHRPSWRHGSIVWRQSYLRSAIGRPIGSLDIDRTVRRIKIASGLIVGCGIIAWIILTNLSV